MTVAIGHRHTRKLGPLGGHLVAAIGVGVLLVTLAAAGAWQASGSGPAAKPATPTWAIHAPTNAGQALTYYVVADEAQAQAVQRAEDDAAQVRIADGDFRPAAAVYVVVEHDTSAIAGEQFGLQDLNAIRIAEGLPEIKVVDLR